jgi:hypothetical protein
MKMNRLVAARARNRYRVSASAMSVPRVVATVVEMNATRRLLPSASARPGRASGSAHASS